VRESSEREWIPTHPNGYSLWEFGSPKVYQIFEARFWESNLFQIRLSLIKSHSLIKDLKHKLIEGLGTKLPKWLPIMNLLNKGWELYMSWIVHFKDYNYSFESFIIKKEKWKLWIHARLTNWQFWDYCMGFLEKYVIWMWAP